MSLKRRLSSLTASLPPDPTTLCCFTLTLETMQPYLDAVHKRFDEGPMSEATVEFLPACLKGQTPCPQGQRYGCAIWRNVARLEHLRDLPEELLSEDSHV